MSMTTSQKKIATVAFGATAQFATGVIVGVFAAPVWAGIKGTVSLTTSLVQHACDPDAKMTKTKGFVIAGTALLEAGTSFMDLKLGAFGWGAAKATGQIVGAVAQEYFSESNSASEVAPAPVVEVKVEPVIESVLPVQTSITPEPISFKKNMALRVILFIAAICLVLGSIESYQTEKLDPAQQYLVPGTQAYADYMKAQLDAAILADSDN